VPETGFYSYRARYYYDAIGRFLIEDLIQFDAEPNFYVYVGNNPATYRDPEGLKTIPADKDVVLPNEEIMAILRCMDYCNGDSDIIVTSGYRRSDVNQRVDGAERSRHLLGMAADVCVPGQTAEQAVLCGAKGVSPYDPSQGGHTHLDIREKEWRGRNGKTLDAQPWWRKPSVWCSCVPQQNGR